MIFRNYSESNFNSLLEDYHYNFIRDVFEARLISYEETVYEYNRGNRNYFNNCISSFKTKIESSIGFCMESFIEYYLSVDRFARLNMLRKCYHDGITEEYSEKCFPLGLGLNSAYNFRKQSFDSKNPHNDINFLKENKNDGRMLTNSKSNSDNVGFQIKAITTNIIDTIITPIMNNKYSQVLTLLEIQDEYGNVIHTKDKCLLYINSNRDKYNKTIRRKLNNLIISPSDIGIPQQQINNYYNYMKCAFNNEYNYAGYIYRGLCLYYNWLCLMGQFMNKQRQIEQLPTVIELPSITIEMLV